MRWLIPIGQMSDGLGHNGRKLTLYAVDHILGCGPWGSSQIENAGAGCIFCVSCPIVWTGGLLLVFLMIDHLHVKHSSCEENYAFRPKMLTRSTTFGPRRYHLSSPLNWWPHWNSVTEWGAHQSQHGSPSPKGEAESACFSTKKSTISPAENVVWSGGGGPTSPIWPWGPTWTWMSCPAGPWGSSFMLALRETLSTYWTNQSSHGWSIVASKRLGQTCPHPMPYCTVRIVLLWDVRVVICALRCRQNFTTIVVSV